MAVLLVSVEREEVETAREQGKVGDHFASLPCD
jgi:hypothetical protein